MTSARLTVLLYHSIGEPRDDLEGHRLPRPTFERHVEALASVCTPVALDDALDRLFDGRPLPERAVAVTFDDGYRDNASDALPALVQHAFPATVFLATGYVVRGEPLWIDALRSFVLGAPSAALDDLMRRSGVEVDADDRTRAFHALRRRLKGMATADRERLLERRDNASPDVPPALTPDDLATMAGSGLVAFGAHSVTHSILARSEPERCRWEVETSRDDVDALGFGRSVTFAYPNGGRADVDRTARAAVRGAGFRYALTTVPGAAGRRSSHLLVPRHAVSSRTTAEEVVRLVTEARPAASAASAALRPRFRRAVRALPPARRRAG